MYKLRSIFLTVLLATCTVVSATTYYVSPSGNNNNAGTLNSPWATWGHAFNSTAVRPGDTVYFRGGVYQMTSDNLAYPYTNGSGYNFSRNGTSDNYICYFAYPGEIPILDCSNIILSSGSNRGIVGNNMNYVHIKGLTLRNVNQSLAGNTVTGWTISGNNIIVENCTVHNTGGWGFVSVGKDIQYLNCDSHHNCDSLTSSLPGNDGVGFQNVNQSIVDGSVYYKNCRAWKNGDQGFSAISIGYLEFDGCWSFNNGQLQGEGHGFKMASVGSGGDQPPFGPLKRKYVNNIAAYNRANGWTTNDSYPDRTFGMQVFNNTSYHNGYPSSVFGMSYGYVVYNTASVDQEELARVYKNNIAYRNQSGNTYISTNAVYTHSNNSWDIPIAVTDADFASLDSTGISARRRADGSLPDNNCYNNFLRLVPGSLLVDRGIDIGLPFSGQAPDLGAFESSSATPTPTTPAYISSVIENATPSTLTLTYNLSLANILPATSAFTVRVNSTARTVTAVAISGTKVSLTLVSPVVHGDVVTVAYTKPATNPLQTTAGGQAVSLAAQNVTNNVAATIPVYVSSVIENATPSTLTLTYNLSLANILPATSAFTVRVNSTARTVTAVAISGTKVSLTLASPVVHGDVVTVAYTKPATNPLQTTAGGQAVSLAAQNVTNNVAATIPVYVSSVIENATPSTLTLTYNLSLANILPATSAFTVRVNSTARTVTAVAISGTKVSLTLVSPVVHGDVVTVAYTKPATNPLQNTAGGQAVSLAAQNVTNNVAATIPVYVSSVIENATPSTLTLTYNLSLANILPATSAFTVRVNSTARTVTAVAISGTKVSLTLASPVVHGDVVTVAYTKPATNPLQTTAGGQAVSLAAQNVTNNVAATIPVYVSSVIENATPSTLTLTYNLSLANILPATSAFTVRVNSTARTVTAVAISGTKVSLTLASPVVHGDVVTVAYTKPATNPLQTTAGGQAVSLAAQNVTNNAAATIPVYVSSVIENATPSTLTLTYNLSLANILPATSAFTVRVNSTARTVTAVAISGTKVSLTLASPVVHGDVVTVAYTKPTTNPLQTTAGGQAVSLAAQNVINNCTLSANMPPVITITSPTKSLAFVAPATITIEATSSDSDGSVIKVEYYNGNTKLGESASPPFFFVWKDVPAGTYSLTATATDNSNAKSVSAAVSVTVEKSSTTQNQLPDVRIKIPGQEKKYLKNEKILMEAIASDPDGTISKVEFKSGNVILAEVNSAPFIFTWEPADTGSYFITAVATDNLGASCQSTEVELSIVDFYDKNSDMVNIYPNPNDGHFMVELYQETEDKQNRITIFSLSGKTVYSKTAPDSFVDMDLSDSPAGTYVMMVTNGKNISTTKKFIIK